MELVLPLHNVFMCVTSDTWWSVLNLNHTQKGGIAVPPPSGCPPLVSAPICPITSVIHPKANTGLCLTVLSYTDGGAVKGYVANVNHPMIVERNFTCIAKFAMGRTLRGSFLIKTCSLTFEQQDPISA